MTHPRNRGRSDRDHHRQRNGDAANPTSIRYRCEIGVPSSSAARATTALTAQSSRTSTGPSSSSTRVADAVPSATTTTATASSVPSKAAAAAASSSPSTIPASTILASADSRFTCTICLDTVKLPVVTQCGHLYCWPCMYQWLEPGMRPEERQFLWGSQHQMRQTSSSSSRGRYDGSRRTCPICKAPCTVSTVVPIFVEEEETNKEEDEQRSSPWSTTTSTTTTTTTSSGLSRQTTPTAPAPTIPPRPTRVIPTTAPPSPSSTIRRVIPGYEHYPSSSSSSPEDYLANHRPSNPTNRTTTSPNITFRFAGTPVFRVSEASVHAFGGGTATATTTQPQISQESRYPFWSANPYARPFGSMPDPFAATTISRASTTQATPFRSSIFRSSSHHPVAASTTTTTPNSFGSTLYFGPAPTSSPPPGGPVASTPNTNTHGVFGAAANATRFVQLGAPGAVPTVLSVGNHPVPSSSYHFQSPTAVGSPRVVGWL